MNRFRKVIDQTLLELKQPEVEAGLCVHSLMATATCRSCVDACPRQAWILDDSALGLDVGICDGCGLCVPACPEGAIQRLHEPAEYRWKERDIALVACERAGLSEAEGTIPCVHSLGVRDLFMLYHKGVKDIMVARGDCSQCDRGEVARLEMAVNGMNRMLHDRELAPMQYFKLSPDKWSACLNTVMTPSKGPEMGRRFFLRQAVGMLVDDQPLEEGFIVDKETWSMPIGQLLPSLQNGSMAPFVPMIDGDRCNGCDACVSLCSHKAITLEWHGEKDTPNYIIKPDNCSGCGLCIDGCEVDAVSVKKWSSPTQFEIKLIQARCPACGSGYHRPEAGEQNEKGLCRICSVVNHYSNLHQVME